jgi:hypothetical protein
VVRYRLTLQPPHNIPLKGCTRRRSDIDEYPDLRSSGDTVLSWIDKKDRAIPGLANIQMLNRIYTNFAGCHAEPMNMQDGVGKPRRASTYCHRFQRRMTAHRRTFVSLRRQNDDRPYAAL